MVKDPTTNRSVSLEPRIVEWIEGIRAELGLRSTDAVVNRLLSELAGLHESPSGLWLLSVF